MSEWQKVYQDKLLYRAEIVRGVLLDNRVSSVIVNKQDSAYQFGHFEVHVAHEDVLRAIKTINEEIRFE